MPRRSRRSSGGARRSWRPRSRKRPHYCKNCATYRGSGTARSNETVAIMSIAITSIVVCNRPKNNSTRIRVEYQRDIVLTTLAWQQFRESCCAHPFYTYIALYIFRLGCLFLVSQSAGRSRRHAAARANGGGRDSRKGGGGTSPRRRGGRCPGADGIGCALNGGSHSVWGEGTVIVWRAIIVWRTQSWRRPQRKFHSSCISPRAAHFF